MLKITFCRPLAFFPASTRNNAKPLQKIYITSRSTRPFATTSTLRDTERIHDTAKVTNGSSDPIADTPSEHRLSKLPKMSLFDLDLLRTRFRELSDRSAITVRQRADDFTAKAASTFSQLGSHLNRVTGYEEIEALKRRVVEQEARITTSRQAARQAKNAYDEAVVRRSNSQREVNDLLQRKSNWTDSDVGRFTTLVREDHLYDQEEVRAKAAVSLIDDAVDREFNQLMRTILARYHEEQVWSDKIRSASTYGSLAALGLNMVIFMLAIIIVEPWKRRRLAQTFEKKIEEMSVKNAAVVDGGMKDLARHFVEQEKLLSAMIEASSASSKSSDSRVLESSEEVPASAAKRIARAAKDWDVATAFAASAVTAAAAGWIAHSWLGF